MKRTTLRTVELITCLVMPVIVAVSVFFRLWYLPLAAMAAAAIMFGVFLSRMKEVYQDEMTRDIDEKAGRATMSIANLFQVLAGSILIASAGTIVGTGTSAIVLFGTVFGLNIIGFLTKLYYKGSMTAK
jgi:uncharacterized membrane protein